MHTASACARKCTSRIAPRSDNAAPDRSIAGTHWVEPFPRLLRRRARRLRGGARRPLRQRRAGAVGRVVYQRVRSVHPWEDWSETCAHYLHMIDTLDTAPVPAPACGLALLPDCPREPSLTDQTPVDEASFENPIKRWFP